MRFFAIVLTLSVMLPAQAQLNPAVEGRLCQAASQDSAFGALVDQLIESGDVQMTAGESLLSIHCPDGQTVLSHMVKGRQAENLEYAVIDMGLSLSASRVSLNGQTVSLGDALTRLGADSDTATRNFVDSYLDDLADEDFNPNLRVSLK
ncbi:hypothetical protein [Alcanivorax sp.]|uniref:hypothetical protein n=1 Tax=Alcanivorax sp. TaxID=1872427 RepID=UPI000C0F8C10|nr:hypothetical protein [Alcanivorax sp.]PHR68418.1 MAG: hypothetical protein COA55_02185 [Alcanivorax sp.]